VAAASAAVAVTALGAAGTPAPDGVTGFEFEDAGPVPTSFVAVTVKVYVVPFVRPEMVALVAGTSASISVIIGEPIRQM